MKWIALGLLGFGLLATPGTAAGQCTDEAAVAAARILADAECDCATASTHGEYVRCVSDVAKDLARDGTLPNECRGEVTRCAAQSTCGKPGAVTCCRIDRNGDVDCSIKSDADKCNPPKDGEACVGTAASCCDACQSTPGGAFVCEPATTTTGVPTTTTAAPTTSTVAPTTTTAAPTTTTTSTAAPTTTSTSSTTSSSTSTSTTTQPPYSSPSGAFLSRPGGLLE